MVTLYRAEGDHSEPGYAGATDVRTGRYFGSLAKALKHCVDDRHLYEITVQDWEAVGNPDDHVLLTSAQAARKTHSSLCPNHHNERD